MMLDWTQIVADGANFTDSGNIWEIEIAGLFLWIWEREITPKFVAGAAGRIVVPFTETVLKGKA